MNRTREIVLVLWSLTSITASALAHSDPRGDVYPNVYVEHGNFVIDFENNDQETEPSPVFRMIFSADGVLLAPRHYRAPRRNLEETIGDAAKNTAQVGDEKIEFSDNRATNPTYTITRNGITETHNLPWPDDFSGAFEAMWADADLICVASISRERMYLSEFDRHHFTPPKMVEVSQPGAVQFIWNFPVMSNVVKIGPRYYVAWMRLSQDRQREEGVISTWKPGENKTQEIILTEPADWNSHLSLGVIGDRLCLAYHCLGGEDYMPRSKIYTIFRKFAKD